MKKVVFDNHLIIYLKKIEDKIDKQKVKLYLLNEGRSRLGYNYFARKSPRNNSINKN